jgi:hypothetical protein
MFPSKKTSGQGVRINWYGEKIDNLLGAGYWHRCWWLPCSFFFLRYWGLDPGPHACWKNTYLVTEWHLQSPEFVLLEMVLWAVKMRPWAIRVLGQHLCGVNCVYSQCLYQKRHPTHLGQYQMSTSMHFQYSLIHFSSFTPHWAIRIVCIKHTRAVISP